MSLSNFPDWKLIELSNSIEVIGHLSNLLRVYDEELDLRSPDVAAWYFGDCDNRLTFLPTEPEFDELPVIENDDWEEGVWS